MSCTLPGREQTNQRAELYAAVQAVNATPEDLHVHSASEFVVNGANALLLHGKVREDSDHDDLWQQLLHSITSRAGRVCFSWVKGHAKQRHIEEGVTTLQHKLGNDAADALATAGAALHAAPEVIAAGARQKRQAAVVTHALLLDLIAARSAAEQAIGAAPADDGEAESNLLSEHDAHGLPSETEPG